MMGFKSVGTMGVITQSPTDRNGINASSKDIGINWNVLGHVQFS